MRRENNTSPDCLAYRGGGYFIFYFIGLMLMAGGLCLVAIARSNLDSHSPFAGNVGLPLLGGALIISIATPMFWRWGVIFDRRTQEMTTWHGLLRRMFSRTRPFDRNVHKLKIYTRTGHKGGQRYLLYLVSPQEEMCVGMARNKWGLSTMNAAEAMAAEISTFLDIPWDRGGQDAG